MRGDDVRFCYRISFVEVFGVVGEEDGIVGFGEEEGED